MLPIVGTRQDNQDSELTKILQIPSEMTRGQIDPYTNYPRPSTLEAIATAIV